MDDWLDAALNPFAGMGVVDPNFAWNMMAPVGPNPWEAQIPMGPNPWEAQFAGPQEWQAQVPWQPNPMDVNLPAPDVHAAQVDAILNDPMWDAMSDPFRQGNNLQQAIAQNAARQRASLPTFGSGSSPNPFGGLKTYSTGGGGLPNFTAPGYGTGMTNQDPWGQANLDAQKMMQSAALGAQAQQSAEDRAERERARADAARQQANVSRAAQQMFGEFQGAYQQAKQANLQRYNDVLAGYKDRAGRADSLLGRMSGQEITDINNRYGQQQAHMQQSAIDRGLGNTTITDSLSRGIEDDRNAELRRANDANIQRQLSTGLGTSADTLGFMERRTDEGPSFETLASLGLEAGKAGGTPVSLGSGAGYGGELPVTSGSSPLGSTMGGSPSTPLGGNPSTPLGSTMGGLSGPSQAYYEQASANFLANPGSLPSAAFKPSSTMTNRTTYGNPYARTAAQQGYGVQTGYQSPNALTGNFARDGYGVGPATPATPTRAVNPNYGTVYKKGYTPPSSGGTGGGGAANGFGAYGISAAPVKPGGASPYKMNPYAVSYSF